MGADAAQQARRLSHGRQKARRLATQALYQWQVAGQDLRDIESQFLEEQDTVGADLEYFHELLFEVPKHVDEIDEALSPGLSRPLDEVDPVERALLRMAAYELKYRLDVPYKVVINEAVRLAKTFGAEEGHKFVNAVLDAVAGRVRQGRI